MISKPSDIAKKKALLRLEMRAMRRAMSDLERSQSSLTTSETLWQFFAKHHSEFLSRPIAVYLARADELSLDPLISRLLEAGFKICAPRVNIEKDEMSFWKLDSLDAVAFGPWKIREPISEERIVPQIVLLPALAFDAKGHRLGMGGGWYDKTLAHLEGVLRIGVCFETQLLKKVPSEPHDLSVDYVASGSGWFDCLRGNL